MADTAAPFRIDALITALNSHDPARVAAFFAAEAVYEDSATGSPVRGQEAIRRLYEERFSAFPDLVMTVQSQVEQGENHIWEWIVTGTHLADYYGIPKTGQAVQIRGVSWCRVRGGSIAEQRTHWDRLALMQQLGVAREPGR